ncbi:MAG: carboxypeptidase regulatory-like domain-containing protein [Verrucomicrobia bacterium]|nr:carboxypeptidase regulatory-like domain-containing protein [Verrucomicrobiota bacterium]
MSLDPKDNALPTATRLRVLVAMPLLILAVLLLFFLARNGWELWSPRLTEGKQTTNELTRPKLKQQAAPKQNDVSLQTPAPATSVADATSPPQPVPQPAVAPETTPAVQPIAGAAPASVIALPVSGGEFFPVIKGRVILQGVPPPEKTLPLDPMCAATRPDKPTTRFFVVGTNAGLADVVVSLKEVPATLRAAAPAQALLLDQRGCEYAPHVFAMRAGQPLLVRNSDPLLHSVHPTPTVQGNAESNKAQPPGAPDFKFAFSQPEEFLRFRCDVHPWMFAYVSVFDHPFFAVTDTNGVFRVPLPPPGRYVLQAAHRKAGRAEKEVNVRAGETPEVNFTLEVP